MKALRRIPEPTCSLSAVRRMADEELRGIGLANLPPGFLEKEIQRSKQPSDGPCPVASFSLP
jgi:hypothetical protein